MGSKAWWGAAYFVFLGIIVLHSVSPCRAVVVSDEPNLHIVTPPSVYDMVGNVLYQGKPGGSSGILIDPWHIVTAKHVLSPGNLSDQTFKLDLADGAHVFTMAARFLHPTADIAVGRLSRSAKFPGYPIYTGIQEVGQTGILLGYGVSGKGAPDANYPRGTKRYGYNRIDRTTSDTNNDSYLLMDFDGPSTPGPYPPGTLGISKEVMMAAGDSGGPTFLNIDGTLYLAGLHSGLSDTNGDTVVPDYTDVGWDVRVSSYVEWIHAQIVPMVNLSLTVIDGTWGHVALDPEPTDVNVPQYPAGVLVTLTAVSEPNRVFSHWEIEDPNFPGDVNHATMDANNPLKIVMNADRQVGAVFKCANGSGMVPLLGLPLIGGLAAIRRRR
jgi:hypothetical protein